LSVRLPLSVVILAAGQGKRMRSDRPKVLQLLAGRALVPELFQEKVTASALGAALLAELDDPRRQQMLKEEFRRIHEQLRCGGAARAASAILECAGRLP